MLGIFGGLGAGAALAACGTSNDSSAAGATSSSASGASSASTSPGSTPQAEVPDETGGPYQGDGSNGPNVLDDSMEGAAVYLWHCNRDGQYSLYPQGVSDEN